MPGLFDSLFSDENSANLALAAGLLGGRGSFNQIAGQALTQGQLAAQGAAQRKRQGELDALQKQRLQLALDEEARKKQQYDAIEAFRRSIPSPDAMASQGALAGGGGPTATNAAKIPQVDPLTRLSYGAMQAGAMGPLDFLKLQQKDTTPIKLGAGEKLLKPGTYQELATNPKSDSPDIQALKLIYGDGTPEFATALKGMMDKKNHTIPQGFNRDEKGNLTVDPNWLSAQIKIHQAAPQATAAGRQATTETALLPQEDRAFMAQQYLAGDKSVMQNLGRGAQGAANIVALRGEIRKQMQASGMSGADMAAKLAEYAGLTAAQRTVGTRTANIELAATEAEKVIPLAKQASNDVARSGLLPFGKVQVMFDEQTNDPALRKFAAANNALVNVYARAIAPTGTPTVHDKEHARAILSTAFDQKSYNAVLEQMQAEIAAARAAPKDVRKAFSEAVSPKSAAVDDLVNKWATKP